jgi:pimeloyl-ACP methyl ester carboxylesterase
MNRLIATITLGASLLLTQPAAAAPRTIALDAASVTVSGSGPRAVILLPGLACGPYVFAGIAPKLAQTYTVYSFTFAGFDGAAPLAKGPYLDAFAKSVDDLIVREHLEKPLIIGHSLGGHLAIRTAEEHPGSVGGILVIDAVPLFPLPQPGETQQARQTGAAAFRDAILGSSDDAYGAQTGYFMAQMVTDPKNVELVTKHDLASDRTTVANAAYELSLADLSPNLSKIQAPVEVLAAAPIEATAAQTAAVYAAQYKDTPHLHVDAIAPSKHFIMFDQPDKFAAAVDAFLNEAQ